MNPQDKTTVEGVLSFQWRSRMGRALALLLIGIATVGTGREAVARTVYDATSGFSPTTNPNGVWSFGGLYPNFNSPFVLNSVNGNYLGVDYWIAATAANLPGAFHNPSGVTNINYGTAVMEPGMLMLHPGAVGEYSVARFTAPTAGSYKFSATFIGQDEIIGTTSDVHLLVNGVSQFDAFINGFHVSATSGSFTMNLAAGDTIDAAVGFGSNGNFYGDSTGLDFTVEDVPSPAGFGLAMFVAAGLGGTRRRTHAR